MTFRLSTRDVMPVGTAALATLLAACGGHAAPAIPTVDVPNQTFSHSATFKFSGKPQRFKVPHVKWLQVVLLGASGGAATSGGARGARVYALIPASLARTLMVYVGGAGNGAKGGFNGGGPGGVNTFRSTDDGDDGYGGGGASDIRLGAGTLGDRVIVAGGGGGAGADTSSGKYSGGAGGIGGGSTGGDGSNGGSSYYCGGSGGDGGSLTAGGTGGSGGQCYTGEGYPGANGTILSGGAGGDGYDGGGGGGGGGGFYGGGGGGGGAESADYGVGAGGGGGGGPSFVGKRAKNARVWPGWKHAVGDGLVVISW